MDIELQDALKRQSDKDNGGMPVYMYPILVFFLYDYVSRFLQHSVFQNILFILVVIAIIVFAFGKQMLMKVI